MRLDTRCGIVIVAALLAVGMQAGCSRQAPAPAPVQATAAKLGDLSAFRRIAADAATMANDDNLTAAKLRIKDLELSWDGAEAGLKPRAAAQWHVLDKAIDDALAALRAEHPDAAQCRQKLSALLQTIDAMHAPL